VALEVGDRCPEGEQETRAVRDSSWAGARRWGADLADPPGADDVLS